jgi:predicted DNA-binding protein
MAIPDNKTRVAVILDKELKDKLQVLANQDNRSMSNYILKLIEDDIKEKGL